MPILSTFSENLFGIECAVDDTEHVLRYGEKALSQVLTRASDTSRLRFPPPTSSPSRHRQAAHRRNYQGPSTRLCADSRSLLQGQGAGFGVDEGGVAVLKGTTPTQIFDEVCARLLAFIPTARTEADGKAIKRKLKRSNVGPETSTQRHRSRDIDLNYVNPRTARILAVKRFKDAMKHSANYRPPRGLSTLRQLVSTFDDLHVSLRARFSRSYGSGANALKKLSSRFVQALAIFGHEQNTGNF
ncbi:uncharacterized protein BYT42DRAFT_615768 [Radiomyces spectabilis]|uniref:uncharacterized protein n=1 Tax=Radiomyces spectabilis TaxID=64574 RepID=UPI00221FF45A|nr:uncharacterized protein BYT42DRAFT_615768 [Radiomyces spectabilis]KAI8374626.1 hypothetical protein BYT42DRAFT_615768 [Radiomyces spectabilis]